MLEEHFTAEELDDMAAQYAAAFTSADGEAVMTAEEAFEEICCDALGGINVFAEMGVDLRIDYPVLDTIRGYVNDSESTQSRAPPSESGSNIEKFSREYSGKNVEWAVENGIISEKERIAFFHKVADIKKLGHIYRRTVNGDYIIELGDKLLFTDADWKSPSLYMVVTFNDSFETSMAKAKEIIFNEAKRTTDYNRARQIIGDAYWEGYAEFRNARDFNSYERENTRGKGTDSKGNTGENGRVKHSAEPMTLKQLEAENKKLKKQLEYWRNQTRKNPKKTVREGDVKKLAKAIVESVETDLKPHEIVPDLVELGNYILNEKELRYTEVHDMAESIATDLVENATEVVDDLKETRDGIKSYLKSVKFIDNGSPEFKELRSKYKRRFRFAKKGERGIGVDTAYMELQDEFGLALFPDEILK